MESKTMNRVTNRQQILQVWAHAPPMAPILVSPKLAASGACYVPATEPAVVCGAVQAGIHVRTQQEARMLQRYIANLSK